MKHFQNIKKYCFKYLYVYVNVNIYMRSILLINNGPQFTSNAEISQRIEKSYI